MARFLTGFAFAAGAGIGIGIGLFTAAKRAPVRRTAVSDNALLKLEPLLERLERLEAFVDAAELRPEQARLSDIEERATAALSHVRSSFETLTREIPSRVEAAFRARIADVEARIQPLAIADSELDRRITERIAPFEKALTDQATRIDSLRLRSEETDVNLQRLIVSIDRLCEVSTGAVPGPVPVPRPGRPLVPMARIFGALLAFGLSRILP